MATAVTAGGSVRVGSLTVPRWAWLVWCVLGIYVCFLTWGVLQERVSTRTYVTDGRKEVFRSFIVLNAAQACVATAWALAYGRLRGLPTRQLTRDTAVGYAQLGAAAAVGAYLGYRSLAFITFPVLLLSKSCKLVPVLLAQTVMERRLDKWYKYASVAVVTAGVAWYMWLEPAKKGHADAAPIASDLAWVGLGLVAINLLLDGFVNAKQQLMFRRQQITAHDLQVYMNVAQAAIMLVYLAVNPVGDNELANAVAFVGRHPAALVDIFLFALAGALGQTFIFLTVESFGSIVLVTITVTRKIITMALSVFWYGHALSGVQWLAVAVVFLGIALESYGDRLFGRAPKAPSKAGDAPSKGGDAPSKGGDAPSKAPSKAPVAGDASPGPRTRSRGAANAS